ncbi:trypsin-like peptidase domain-containing protein [Geitlerinema sp. P-1104]|uniref:trypsin-like peptidase domain-containing protein n=1 Tax=Geitlerinema sp. P-1104 TaxID=2546230 RepID=UPI001980B5E5|nr:trypsin-like peptidase domain-containing protein [Geitlerinema sp. P-1104]
MTRQNSKRPRTQSAMGFGIFLLGLTIAITIQRGQNQDPTLVTAPPQASSPESPSPPESEEDRREFGQDSLAEPPAADSAEDVPASNPETGDRSFDQTNFIVRAVRRVEPSVVRIEPQRLYSGDDLGPSDLLEPIPYSPYSQSAGTGFVIDDEGHLLTNAHVVGSADQVRVVLHDGQVVRGQVLGRDTITDVAVVKLDGVSLAPVPIGDSDDLKPGEWAIAIGNPLGLDSTVTMGIISATGRSSREIGVPDRRVGFIQTDAAINPGNSGGPLLNASGSAIGINTAILDGAQGLGFAIPIKTALRVGQQIIRDGTAQHPYLGVRLKTLDADLKAELAEEDNFPKLTVEQGVLITDVVPNSPAAAAGLQIGDVILRIGDVPVVNFESVQRIVEESPIGEALELGISRGQDQLTLDVRPGQLPEN